MTFRGVGYGMTVILLSMGCADGAPTPTAPLENVLAEAKGGKPGGGDDGGSGGDTQTELGSGLVAASQAVSVSKDNKVALTAASGAYVVQSALTATRSLAADDVDAMTACVWEVPAGAESLKADLVAALVDGSASSRGFEFQVDKRAALSGAESSDHYMTLRADELDASPVVFLGRNNAGTGNFLVITYSDGDTNPNNDGRTISDGSETRRFTATDGTVRVVKRFDQDGDGAAESNEPIVSMRCPNLDTVVLTVRPAS